MGLEDVFSDFAYLFPKKVSSTVSLGVNKIFSSSTWWLKPCKVPLDTPFFSHCENRVRLIHFSLPWLVLPGALVRFA